jgi:predicted acetyltransferase
MGLDTLEMGKLSSQQAKKARKLKHDFTTKIRINDVEITCMKDTVVSVGVIKCNK